MRDRDDMWTQTRLDEYETQIEFKNQNDTLFEFGDRDGTPSRVSLRTSHELNSLVKLQHLFCPEIYEDKYGIHVHK